MSYSLDLKERVINWVRRGKSRLSASQVFEVHYQTVKAWLTNYKDTGEYAATPRERSKHGKVNLDMLRQEISASPDSFQSELACHVGVSQSTISRTLAKLDITHKKKTTRYLEASEEPQQAFVNATMTVTNETLVYLDECGIPQNLYRESGWAPRGEEVFGKRTGKREPKLNLIAADTEHQLKSPFFYEGVMNTALFNTDLTEFLLPVLTPGQIVVMDNASFHKSAETRRLIESNGCQLWFLPTYSPQLNPIEHLWAVLKRYVRRFQPQFASLTDTLDFIFQSVPLFQGN
jgi:transposase